MDKKEFKLPKEFKVPKKNIVLFAMEEPESCAECPCSDYCTKTYLDMKREKLEVNEKCKKPDWCPLQPLPERKPHIQYSGNGVIGINQMCEHEHNLGYNECRLRILLGGGFRHIDDEGNFL